MSSPYSPVFAAGRWRAISGQIGLTADGLDANFGVQLDAALANMDALLNEHGLRRDQVVKTTVYLSDMSNYDELNERYTVFFGDHRPARSAVAVAGLPLGALVEIDAWVHAGS